MKGATPLTKSSKHARVNSAKRHGVRKSLDRDPVFRQLATVADGIAQALGPVCEVVVHDFRDLEHSIVHISGSITGRRIGGSVTDLGLRLLSAGLEQVPQTLVYETTAPNGRRLKSTSTFLMDSDGQPFGAVCINLDISSIHEAAAFLRAVGSVSPTPTVEETFSDNPAEIVASMVRDQITARVADGRAPTHEDRVAIVQDLKRRGVFNLRNGVALVAAELGVSRYSVYKYLGSSVVTG